MTEAPVVKWLSDDWEMQKALLMKISFIDSVILHPIQIYDKEFPAVTIHIKVDLPQGGPVCDVNPIEPVGLVLWPSFPYLKPLVLLRYDFPAVPHLGTRKDRYRGMCLTRQDPSDWWTGKTLIDLAKAVYDWLCDAAAGILVKEDDPFEPLIASGTVPVILDVALARSQCLKNNGTWKTASKIKSVKGGEGTLFMVGKGDDVHTHIFYQDVEQSSLWIDPPGTVGEMVSMADSVGFDIEQLNYWMSKSKTHSLFIFGIKRPCGVLGKSGAEEWVAFEFKRHKSTERCAWEIEAHLVLETFSKEQAAITSGIDHSVNNSIVLGCGAIGSEVCESLIRSGVTNITAVDNDILVPHNLARHTLDANDIGEYKAASLATKLNGLFSSTVFNAVCEDFLGFDESKLGEITSKTCCLIDCTASIAVQCHLSDIAPSNLPVLCCYQINSGGGTVLLYTPDNSKIRLDMLETIFVTELRNNKSVSTWLSEAGKTIPLGGGCRSISSIINGGVIKFGAGWIADWVSKAISKNSWPQKAFITMLEHQGIFNELKKHMIEGEATKSVCGQWTTLIADKVSQQINEYALQAAPNETGGILIGRIDKQRKIAYITEAWQAPKDSVATNTGFSRGLAGLQAEVAMLEKDTEEYLTYVGEWHSHPPNHSTQLSATDSVTAKRMANELEADNIPAVCLITNGHDWRTHIVE